MKPIRWAGLTGGPVVALLLYTLVGDETLGHAGRATLALMGWMGIWWLTEAIDVAATALLPVAILPLLTFGAHDGAGAAMKAAAAPYAHPFIALFIGGFILALAMERWELHRRIALVTLRLVGPRPMSMIAGFMGITAVMSMWVSNTATTAMMLPIALSVTALMSKPRADDDTPGRVRPEHFGVCLMLGIAYAASVGGIGTLIGTPPNVLLAAFLEEEYGTTISFVRWLGVGLPLVIVFAPLIWLLLTRVIYPIDRAPIPGGRRLIAEQLTALGPMKRGEWVTLVVFLATASAWIFRPLIARVTIGDAHPFAGLSDAGIAIIAALALFVIPTDLKTGTFTMNWEWAKRLPWGILILFGGGLSLAAAVSHNGVADYFGQQASGLGAMPAIVITIAITAGVIFLTELTSNTATTAALLPILAGIAPTLGLPPLALLVPATVAASCAFMMPVATPPNAIVFGSGHVTIPQMCKAGLWLNLIGIIFVTILTYAVALPLLRAAG